MSAVVTETADEKLARKIGEKIVQFTALAIAVAFVWLFVSCLPTEPPRVAAQPSVEHLAPIRDLYCGPVINTSGARAMAERFVLQRLKAPATAVFSTQADLRPMPADMGASVALSVAWVAREGECTYVVKGWVDSQNGFGAQIRSSYMVEMHPTHIDPVNRTYTWDASRVIIHAPGT